MGVVRDGVASFLAPRLWQISLLVALAGTIWLSMFDAFDRPTVIEEHGLVPGYAQHGFITSHSSRQLGAMRQELKEATADISSSRSSSHAAATAGGGGGGVAGQLQSALERSGLPAYNISWSYFDGEVRGTTVVAVVPSARGDSRESIVLVMASDWRDRDDTATPALGLALADYLQTVQWLARDVIVIFTDRTLPYAAGVRAFLDGYLRDKAPFPRRGLMRQAVIFEIDKHRPNQVAVTLDIEGVNGLQPNQDLVNAYAIEAKQDGIRAEPREAWDSVNRMATDAGADRIHSAFLQRAIPAFTAVASSNPRGGNGQPKLTQLGGSLEGILRCQSSALQALHHSFNFYFFTSPNSHVSSGLYLYPVFGMLMPLAAATFQCRVFSDVGAVMLGATVMLSGLITGSLTSFALATQSGLVDQLSSWGIGGLLTSAPSLLRWRHAGPLTPSCTPAAAHDKRQKASVWVWVALMGYAAVGLICLVSEALIRQPRSSRQPAKGDSVAKGNEATGEGQPSIREMPPLWMCVKSVARAMAILTLAPLTVYNWAASVYLTPLVVPPLLLVEPLTSLIDAPQQQQTTAQSPPQHSGRWRWKWRPRLRRSHLFVLRYLLLTWLLLFDANLSHRKEDGAAHGSTMAEWVLHIRHEAIRLIGHSVASVASLLLSVWSHSVPRQFAKYGPRRLLAWLRQVGEAVAQQTSPLPHERPLFAVYRMAQDYRCVEGMSMAVVWFVYLPFLFAVVLVLMLPERGRGWVGGGEGKVKTS
ncbi:unnamed protein product [Vitrella brassicaformis CCMP3155]|uniref:Uncharacterized protein n=1 Tax=Vitrella brassicaformis (strain CCMP3155) TaxID=1169540 RepID=A0A0G4GS83_VITBC|nr:unnamed protein product [Vitrella brassicaformis CCMP3155]|eukprot:CEM33228.1 unnamed protein product [Vitrella brassicaformis CCMP3155]